jgi:hypothetical protein
MRSVKLVRFDFEWLVLCLPGGSGHLHVGVDYVQTAGLFNCLFMVITVLCRVLLD